MFQDKDPEVLYAYYMQLGKSKELLIECMLNGGEMPEGFGAIDEDHQEEEKLDNQDQGLGDLVGVDMDADPEIIAR